MIPNCVTTPSERPQANGKNERFHQELGKLSCIYNYSIFPDEAVIYLQTELKKAFFFNGIRLNTISDSSDSSLALATIPAKFQIYDFVYREIQTRKRAKHQDTFSGPHMIV